jgi:hypothetical protein
MGRILGSLPMPGLPIQVHIVDDGPSVCTACACLLRSAKMQPRGILTVLLRTPTNAAALRPCAFASDPSNTRTLPDPGGRSHLRGR